jgi:hypothetical protein
VLNASGTLSANYTSVLIYPTGTGPFSISATGNFATISLDGADNVTIDGRINQSGSTNSLSITGTSIEAAASALRLVNSAENNTVKYCNFNASPTSSAIGVVTFGGSSSGNGNDNNIVEYCNITCSGSNRPYNGIHSSGSGGRENNGCIIRNNNIYNTFQTGVSSNGININSASVGFTISGNSIYETTAFVAAANPLAYNAIRVSTLSEHTVSGNYIGGSQPLCAGTAWSFVGQRAVYFCGIYAYAGSVAATTISNNTIANIAYSSKEDNPWDGIFLFTGNFDVSGNTIGASTGTGSITLTTPLPVATTTIVGGVVTAINLLDGGGFYNSANPPAITFTAPPAGGTMPTATATISEGGVVTGFTSLTGGSGYTTAPAVIFDGQSNNYSTSHGMIQNSNGTVNITGNNVGAITTVGSNYYSHGFESIYVRTIASTTTLTNNLIGSRETANSIHVSSAAALSLIKQDVYGIYSAGTLTTVISGNTVANLTNAYSGVNAGSRNRGIQTVSGSNTISNNTVYNLTSASLQTAGGTSASAIGISQTSTTAGTTQTVNGNTVYNIINTQTTAAKSCVTGIYYNGPVTGTHTISGNFVHSLTMASSNVASDMEGIELANGIFTCANNIVSIGKDIGGGYVMNGIWDESTNSLTRNLYFNTIYIGGSASSGASATTALRSTGNTATRDYRNNILFNARSSGGKHYAIILQGNTGLNIDYNDYWVSGTNGVLGYLGADKATLALLRAATGGDLQSSNDDPQFLNAGGTSAINYFPSATLNGVSGTGITTDYYNITRHLTTPKMGALEQNGNVWQGITSTDFNTALNWAGNAIPSSGADIIFATSPTNDCVLDANRTVGNITNGSSKNLVVNGKTLTVNGSLNFTSSGKINTSTALSVVEFVGLTAQTIPSAAFVGNTVAGLTIANSSGVALNGNLTVTAALALTSGVLAVGANTFTYSGSSPTSAGGTVDASNALAEIVFANATAITLPATFFTGAVNNFTISASGGVRAGSDITVNGVLNLAAANPSATKGLLEMVTNYGTYPGRTGTNPNYYTDYSSLSSFTLFMGPSATTAGTGDVTGIVKRNYTITANTPYTFGNQFTTISLTAGTAMPSSLSVTITIGTTAIGPINDGSDNDIIRDAVKRTYEIIPANNASGNSVTANFHYLDSELTSSVTSYVNSEQKLTTMDYDIGPQGFTESDEHGRANYDYTNNFIGLSSVPISYFIYNASTHDWRTIFALRDYGEGYYTWDGSQNTTDWNDPLNWTLPHGGSGIPPNTGHVIIPNVTSTNNRSPILPARDTINTISIENGGILTMGSNTLVIQNTFSGGWEDQNPLGNDPGTSTVIFNRPNTTISGTATRFYNVEIGDGADITNQTGSTMKIANSITKSGSGKWYADVFGATIEYNGGAQTVIHPDGTPDYHHLKLSGSGNKTMPGALSLHGNFTLSGTASATAASEMSIGGNLSIETGTTFATGAFDHTIGSNIICDGTLTPTSGKTITMNGTTAQNIGGTASTIAFNNLKISNLNGVTLNSKSTSEMLDISSGAFTITAGKSLTSSGTTTLGSAQCLVLKSDASGTASFIDNGTISGSGTAKIERYITPYDVISDLKFHFLSCPIGTQAIEPEFIDLSSSLVTDFYKWNETDNLWVSYRKGGWLLGENPDYFLKNPAFTESNFMQGSGYMVAYPSAFTKNYIGVPNTSTAGITITCTKSGGGWNLIGNPFPSSVDWTLLSKGAGMDAALYYYDNAAVAYRYYSFFSGGLAGASQFIAPMQGFMVHANTGTQKTVTFSNAARTHSGQDIFYKDAPLTTNILDLKVEGNGKADYARVCFYEEAFENFDGDFDAFKIFSYSPSTSELYSKTANNTSLAINTLPLAIMDGGQVPVHFKVGTPGNFTLSAEKLNTFSSNTYILLEDRITGTLQKLNDNPVYAFSSSSQDAVDRFVLHFKDATSISEPASQQAITAWYNNCKLTIATLEGTTNVNIFNIQGQNLQNFQLHGSSLQSVSINLPTGIYFAWIINEDTMQTIKMIVQ